MALRAGRRASGGGWNAISREIADAAGWPIKIVDTGQGELSLVPFPAFDEGHGIPAAPAYFFEGQLAVALGFQVDAEGRRTTHFPSLDIEVDGEVLPVLFDTGATAHFLPAPGPTAD